MWREGCRAATQREARQPIGSSSSTSCRTEMAISVMRAGMDLEYMLTDFRSICLGPGVPADLRACRYRGRRSRSRSAARWHARRQNEKEGRWAEDIDEP